jgi:MFS family permease
MLVYPLQKLIHLRKSTPDGIAAIYINSALRTFAVSLVGIFLPVFLFLRAQDFFGKGIEYGIYGIVIYFLIHRIMVTLALLPTAKMISKIGFRWSIFTANIFLIVLLGLLSFADEVLWVIPVAAVLHGLQNPLYWLSYRSLFATEGVLSNLGREVGFSAIATQLAGIAGPVLGGVIITVWGFPSLFIVALLVVIMSGVPFFLMPKHKHTYSASVRDVVEWLKKPIHRNEELAFLGRRIDDFVITLFWPVFVFLILGDFERQGLLASLGLIASALMVYVAGRVFDTRHSYKAYRFGVIGNSIMWLLRGFGRNLGQLLMVETTAATVSPFYWVTYDSLLYERARDKDEKIVVFMMGRHLIVNVAMFVVLLVAFIVARYDFRFWVLWFIASLGTLSTLYMWEKKKPHEEKK